MYDNLKYRVKLKHVKNILGCHPAWNHHNDGQIFIEHIFKHYLNLVAPGLNCYSAHDEAKEVVIYATKDQKGYQALNTVKTEFEKFKVSPFNTNIKMFANFFRYRKYHNFMIEDEQLSSVLGWIFENCKSQEYKLISIYEGDVTLCLANKKAVAFKLWFNEEITS